MIEKSEIKLEIYFKNENCWENEDEEKNNKYSAGVSFNCKSYCMREKKYYNSKKLNRKKHNGGI